MSSRRPSPDEYDAFYTGYVEKVPDGDIIAFLAAQGADVVDRFANLRPERIDYSYAPGKWTTRQVLGHLTDVEWILTYRALRFARGDTTPLPGMDQDDFMAGANFADRDLRSMLGEFSNLRSASIALFSSFGEEILGRSGTANSSPVSVRALPYIIGGHAQHHLDVLAERYL